MKRPPNYEKTSLVTRYTSPQARLPPTTVLCTQEEEMMEMSPQISIVMGLRSILDDCM